MYNIGSDYGAECSDENNCICPQKPTKCNPWLQENNEMITRADCVNYTEIIELSFQDVYTDSSGPKNWTRETCMSHCEAVGMFQLLKKQENALNFPQNPNG